MIPLIWISSDPHLTKDWKSPVQPAVEIKSNLRWRDKILDDGSVVANVDAANISAMEQKKVDEHGDMSRRFGGPLETGLD